MRRVFSRYTFRHLGMAGLAMFTTFLATSVNAAVIDDVRKLYGPSSVVDADIDMTIWWAVREKEEKKSGHLLLAPGDRFDVTLGESRWVCDGRILWQYSGDANQVVIKRLLDIDLSAYPSQVLSTYLMKYSYSVDSQNEKEAVLSWKSDPTNPDRDYRSITLSVDPRKAVVQKLEVVDTNGNRSTYLFRKTRFGIKIEPKTFTFAIPEGAHVLDVRD